MKQKNKVELKNQTNYCEIPLWLRIFVIYNNYVINTVTKCHCMITNN